MSKKRPDDDLPRRKRRVPAWWADAKLGIFVHWTPASVPGFAPTGRDIGSLMVDPGPHPLSEIPYSEWYENSLRFENSSVARFHREHYGSRPYRAFADEFVAGLERWDPTAWARIFAATGARYVVLVTKHHDGWCLWPSEVTNPHRVGWQSQRDIVGELAEAVRGEGMRFGVYYSGAYDWSFDDSAIGTVGSGLRAIPGGEYVDYAEAHVRELIDRYRPSVLWNDIGWPAPKARLDELFRYYFAAVPDGVVNDRWMPTGRLLKLAANPHLSGLVDRALRASAEKSGGLVPPEPPFYGYQTPEFVEFDEIRSTPFEIVRGFDRGFGYNQTSTEDDFISRRDLELLLVGAAATGGNLMANVGPRGIDASIPEEQMRRLRWLAEIEPLIAMALRDTRPWVIPKFCDPHGTEVRFVARGESVFAWIWPSRTTTDGAAAETTTGSLVLPLRATARTRLLVADPDERTVDGSTSDGIAWCPLSIDTVHLGSRIVVPNDVMTPPATDDPRPRVLRVDHAVAMPFS